MGVFVRARTLAYCLFLPPVLLMRLVSEKQRQRISPQLLSLHSSSCPKLILILNVSSGSGSGQVRDCLPFPPSGHLKLHLIQMPICSTQIGTAAWLAGLFGHFVPIQYKGVYAFACACARAHVSCPSMRVYTGPSQLGASIIGEQGASGGVGLSVTV